MIRNTIVIAAVLALAVALPAVSAQAQAARTFVSIAGTDNATCGINAPCRHFQAAVTATAAEGEVDALDPGNYGGFTVSHAITIEGQGWAYIAPAANGAAITIAAGSTDRINIRGVSLNGVGVANGTGILLNSGQLILQNSVIQFLTTGLDVTNTHADVINTAFIGNSVAIETNGAGVAYNSNVGIYIPGPCTTVVRINSSNFVDNTTVFNENSPTSTPPNPTATIWYYQVAPFMTGYTTLMTITGTGSGGNNPGPQGYSGLGTPPG
jgi:hypothetical protein